MAFGSKPLRGELLLPTSVGQLAPPDHLSPEAKEHWSDLVRVMGPAGLLAEVDGIALAMLCENLADYWTLRQDVRSLQADNVKDEEDRKAFLLLRSKLISNIGKLDQRVREWLNELLLTPLARSRSSPMRAMVEEKPMDLSILDADERAALREMLAKRGEQRVLQ